MAQVTLDEELLVDAFRALEEELHKPHPKPHGWCCTRCHVVWRIEQALGREFTDNRELHDIDEIRAVRAAGERRQRGRGGPPVRRQPAEFYRALNSWEPDRMAAEGQRTDG